MPQDFSRNEEGDQSLSIYFLTNRRLYELIYQWVEIRELGRVEQAEQREGFFAGPLQEFPLRGGAVMQMVRDVEQGRAVAISLASANQEKHSEGEALQIEASSGTLPMPIVFMVPSARSHNTRQEVEQQDQSASSAGRTKFPFKASTEQGHSEQRYDVIVLGSRQSRLGNTREVAMPYKEAFTLARSFEQDEGALILRYYNEQTVPPGKKRDSLEWLNPQYGPLQEPHGFFFRGLYFETVNVIEVQGEEGPEKVPSEVYLATAFQVERGAPRDVSIYRPFGTRSDGIDWLNRIAHVKASITRLVPDPGSTNWFVLSDMQNLNPLGFRQEGEAEWLN